MSPQYSGLKLLLSDSLVDVEDACKTHASLVREVLINNLLLIGLDDNDLRRIRLGEAFRRSLQTERQSTPYRLHSVISACKESTIDASSLESTFYKHGGVRAVTALAAAAVDGKNIMQELEGLTDSECESLVTSIDSIKWHADLEFMAESMSRKRKAITSKRTQLVRPRPSRSTRNTCRDIPGHSGLHQRRDRIHPSHPNPNRPVVGANDRSNSQGRNPTSQFGTARLTPIEGLSTEVAMAVTNASTLAYDPVFDVATETSGTIAGGNYGIDLDCINYGIDLDRINAL